MTRPAFIWPLLVLCACVAGPDAVFAQTPPTTDLVTPPGNVLLPNYNNVPVGPNAGLEGNAYVARVSDPSAAWLNPAGLSRAKASEISGSAGLFQLASVSPSTLPDTGGSVQQLPSLVGFTIANAMRKGWTAGLSILTATSWSQQTDSQLVVDHGTSRERFAYSADSDYQQHVGAASVGYTAGGLRMGGGLAFVYTSISKNEVISDRLAGPTNLRTLLFETRATGSALQLRPLFGAQFDLSPHLLVGAMMRTPALTLFKSATRTSDGVAENGLSSIGASFFDADARFANHLPFEFSGGVAYTGAKGEIEVDVQAYTPVSAYAMIASDQPLVTYVNAGSGSGPVIDTRPNDGAISQFRGMANVAVGGHVVLTSSGVWRLHFGLGSDFSPVGDEDKVFTKVNLFTWSLGISGTKGPLQFTAGVNYRSGSSDNVIVRNLQNGDLVTSGMDVRTIGLIYALSYKF
jgi:hypothetical protein